MVKKGRVFLVGAGPGDPGLLTLRGREVLSQADVVLYDALVHPDLLEHAPPGALRIFRGSRGKKGALNQAQINRKLVQYALQGKKVVRLKGGDPFVFGRGGEELLALVPRKIPFEVVPGVSSSYAVPTAAGIPLSHRGMNASFTVVTGHETGDKPGSQIDWAHLARDRGTLVFLMGLHTLPEVSRRLLSHGMDPKTPAAVVQKGTTRHQKSVRGVLSDIAAKVHGAKLQAPAILVLGKVVALSKWLDPEAHRPLKGLRVLVTRNLMKAGPLTQMLKEKGAEVVEAATIELRPLPLGPRDRRLLEGALDYDWIVLSSAPAVEFLKEAFQQLGFPLSRLRPVSIACVGPSTAKAARAAGLVPSLVPKDFKQEGLVHAFRRMDLRGQRVLFIRAKEGRDVLQRFFRAQRVPCDLLPLYENHVPPGAVRRLRSLFKDEGGVDLLTFASSSAAEHFYGAFTPAERERWLAQVPAAVIGPVTGATVRQWGGRVVAQPKVYTLDHLVDAIGRWAKKRDKK
ncbi:MAG TPA: uroporphyrinogen-III C-methyltransferase [bacterium]|nr:uroporphyrinogen-III C-methyltransferase [bacterium]